MTALTNAFRTICEAIFGSSKKVVVIEEIEDHFEVLEGSVDEEKRVLRVEKHYSTRDISTIRRSRLLFDAVHVSLTSSKATTIESLISLKRSMSRRPVTEIELEGLLFKALWEFLHTYRAWTARKMRVSDLDLMLMEVDVGTVSLDGRVVATPIGLEGQLFGVRLRGTFMPRSMFSIVAGFLSRSRTVSVVERGSVLAGVFSDDQSLIASVTSQSTTLFSVNATESKYVGDYDWGTGAVVRAVASFFLLDEKNAATMLARYCDKRLSERVARLVQKCVDKECEPLFTLLSRSGRMKDSVSNYVNFYPLAILDEKRANFFRIRLINGAALLRKLDYTIHVSNHISYEALSSTALLLLSGLPTHPVHSAFTRLLRRRARWLIRTNNVSAAHEPVSTQ